MKKIQFCGCGHGIATHPYKDLDGLRVHIIGEGNCCREIVLKEKEPKNFRMEIWTSLPDTEHETTFLTEVCEVNGQTITKYTLTNQRLYSYNEEFDNWSKPKSSESINSLSDNF